MSNKNDITGDPTNALSGVIEEALNKFADELLETAEGLGDSLSADQIRSILKSYLETPQNFASAHADFSQILSNFTDKSGVSRRAQVLQRVLVGRVESLFATQGDLGKGRQILSRRALPGLFESIKIEIGTEPFNKHFDVCLGVLGELKAKQKGPVSWSALHRDETCNKSVDFVLMEFSHKLVNRGNYLDWLCEQINTQLAPASEFEFEGGNVSDWKMERKKAQLMLRGLYAKFLLKLDESGGEKELVEQFGEEKVNQLKKLLENLRGGAS